jgi:tRNA-dihydrouridine synthase
MLINGDLIRIPQGTIIMEATKEVVPLSIAAKPRLGIIIDNKPTEEDLVKILLDDQVFFVHKRVVQLVVS